MWGKALNSISCGVMRPVSGFERPGLQWSFVALGVLLLVVAAGEAVGLRRARGQMEALRAADLGARIERDQLQARAAREQSARESLSLEVGRLRANQPGASQPTLTLSPLQKRGAKPPEATVEKPADNQVIQLRLVLPPGRPSRATSYTVVVRTWSGGDTIWSRSGLSSSTVDNRQTVTAYLTGDVFAPGAYEIALSGSPADMKTTEVAAYEVAVRPPPDR
jgi:hypothetical protein